MPLLLHIFIWKSPVFFCEKTTIRIFNIFIYFHYWVWYQIQNLWCHVKSSNWVLNPVGQLRAISKISSRTFCIGRNMFHICILFLWLVLFCTVFICVICFHRYVHISYRLLRVPVNYIFRIFRSWKICNPVILRSTSEAHILSPTLPFSTLIFKFVWIEVWTKFIMFLILYLFLNYFQLGVILNNDCTFIEHNLLFM